MIWLTWRQFRVQALGTLAAFSLLAAYLVILGAQLRSSSADVTQGMQGSGSGLVKEFGSQVTGLGAGLFAMPALIGVFWGAQLVAREFEDGTYRLVWNQSITRTRWLAVKLGVVGLAGLIVTGLFTLLLTWSTSRFDQLKDDRFGALTFGARGLVPIGYALFAFTLAAVVGLIVRRTVLAMVITLAIYAVVQLVVPNAIRAHYLPPETTSVAFTTEARQLAVGLDTSSNPAVIAGYHSPGTWALSSTSEIRTTDGMPVDGSVLRECQQPRGGPQARNECLDELGLRFDYTYQPASRYWPFQLIELSIFLTLSALMLWLGFRLIRTRG